jgi:hypothetical protein
MKFINNWKWGPVFIPGMKCTGSVGTNGETISKTQRKFEIKKLYMFPTFLCPSSGVSHRIYGYGLCHTGFFQKPV